MPCCVAPFPGGGWEQMGCMRMMWHIWCVLITTRAAMGLDASDVIFSAPLFDAISNTASLTILAPFPDSTWNPIRTPFDGRWRAECVDIQAFGPDARSEHVTMNITNGLLIWSVDQFGWTAASRGCTGMAPGFSSVYTSLIHSVQYHTDNQTTVVTVQPLELDITLNDVRSIVHLGIFQTRFRSALGTESQTQTFTPDSTNPSLSAELVLTFHLNSTFSTLRGTPGSPVANTSDSMVVTDLWGQLAGTSAVRPSNLTFIAAALSPDRGLEDTDEGAFYPVVGLRPVFDYSEVADRHRLTTSDAVFRSLVDWESMSTTQRDDSAIPSNGVQATKGHSPMGSSRHYVLYFVRSALTTASTTYYGSANRSIIDPLNSYAVDVIYSHSSPTDGSVLATLRRHYNFALEPRIDPVNNRDDRMLARVLTQSSLDSIATASGAPASHASDTDAFFTLDTAAWQDQLSTLNLSDASDANKVPTPFVLRRDAITTFSTKTPRTELEYAFGVSIRDLVVCRGPLLAIQQLINSNGQLRCFDSPDLSAVAVINNGVVSPVCTTTQCVVSRSKMHPDAHNTRLSVLQSTNPAAATLGRPYIRAGDAVSLRLTAFTDAIGKASNSADDHFYMEIAELSTPFSHDPDWANQFADVPEATRTLLQQTTKAGAETPVNGSAADLRETVIYFGFVVSDEAACERALFDPETNAFIGCEPPAWQIIRGVYVTLVLVAAVCVAVVFYVWVLPLFQQRDCSFCPVSEAAAGKPVAGRDTPSVTVQYDPLPDSLRHRDLRTEF